MSFYIVPSMSYQTQQKMKKEKDSKKKKKKRSSKLGTHEEGGNDSSSSSTTSASSARRSSSISDTASGHKKSNASSMGTIGDGSPSTHRLNSLESIGSKGNAVNAEELKQSLSNLASRHNEGGSVSGGPSSPVSHTFSISEPSANSSYYNTRNNSLASSIAPSTKSNPNPHKHLGGSFSSSHSKLSTSGRHHSIGETSALSGTRFSRKMSSTFMGNNNLERLDSTGSSNKRLFDVTGSGTTSPKTQQPPIFKPSYTESQFSPSHSQQVPSPAKSSPRNVSYTNTHSNSSTILAVRPFVPVVNLEILNSTESMHEYIYKPEFQALRYQNLLENIRTFHISDPIIFASVRYNSLVRFIRRILPLNNNFENENRNALQDDIRLFESRLIRASFKSRSFLRELIRKRSRSVPNTSEIVTHEELVQVNFANYMRYLINLPPMNQVPSEQLTDEIRNHYYYKDLFQEIQERLYALRKEELGEDGVASFAVNSTEFIVQSITKISFEFILLEKYLIQILSKLSGTNHVFERRGLEMLFKAYCDSTNEMKQNDNNSSPTSLVSNPSKKFRSVKVLNYNAFYSSLMSWYMAVLTPFVNVYEMSSYSEDPELVNDMDKYYEHHEKNHTNYASSFHVSEEKIYEEYFKKIDFKNDFANYKEYTPEKLVRLQEKVEGVYRAPNQSSSSTSDLNERGKFLHKPRNFQFYNKSLSTIPDETFDYVHCRDISLQFTLSNYKTIIREFHRILRKGGALEFSTCQFGTDDLNSFIANNGIRSGSPLQWNTDFLRAMNKYTVFPNLIEEVLKELGLIFGDSNVKYGFVLLNSANDVNMYILKCSLMRLLEMDGRMEACTVENGEEYKEQGAGIHYFIMITAEKK